jgi:glycosyltransferase involved in cell wall biosynthesis
MTTEILRSFAGDPASDVDALVSILICNYDSAYLENCLDSILTQKQLGSFEIIICDDASRDGGWTIANRYALANPGIITITRNNIPFGLTDNKNKGMQMCRGKYRVELTARDEFDASYVGRTIKALRKDKYLDHAFVSKIKPANFFQPPQKKSRQAMAAHRTHEPLVSICIYNYNYGRYLRQCLDSVMAQTYKNIEICFSDNASTDDSWNLALEYAEAAPDRMSLSRNRVNFGPNINLYNCVLNMRGKYILKLCSDDAMHPEFIARCVAALEQHSEAAFAMVHREILDDEGNRTYEPPFYEESCLIPGQEQAAVYMMSSVNPSISQIVYNLDKLEGKRMAGNLNDRWFGDRIVDFHICCEAPIVYIKEPLLLNRIHDKSDGAQLGGNLLQCMGEFVLLHQLVDIADGYPGMAKTRERLGPAVDKLGRLCLRYCLRALGNRDNVLARRYFQLATAISPEVGSDPVHEKLATYWNVSPDEQRAIFGDLTSTNNLVWRSVSYPAPPGSVLLQHDTMATKTACHEELLDGADACYH